MRKRLRTRMKTSEGESEEAADDDADGADAADAAGEDEVVNAEETEDEDADEGDAEEAADDDVDGADAADAAGEDEDVNAEAAEDEDEDEGAAAEAADDDGDGADTADAASADDTVNEEEDEDEDEEEGEADEAAEPTVRTQTNPATGTEDEELRNIVAKICQEVDEGMQPWHSYLLPSHLQSETLQVCPWNRPTSGIFRKTLNTSRGWSNIAAG
jgi:hypothetical protein